MNEMFGKHCETAWYGLKFHLLDHLVDNLERFVNLETFEEWLVETFNEPSKRPWRRIFQRQWS